MSNLGHEHATKVVTRHLDRMLPGPYRWVRRYVYPEIRQRRIRAFVIEHEQAAQSTHFPNPASSLAIVVPCYQHAGYLETMVTSIKRQSRPPDQVIFVEDHSADDGAHILHELIEEWRPRTPSQLMLIRNEQNLGQATSLNRGIEEAETDLIMIANDDDYLLHDCVEVAFMLFRRYPEVALIGAHFGEYPLQFSGDEALSQLPKLIREFLPPEQLELDLRQTECVNKYRRFNDLNMTHTGSCFQKAAWKTAGGYQPDKKKCLVQYSDRDFQLRVNALFPVAVSPDIPFSCWRNDSSVDVELNS